MTFCPDLGKDEKGPFRLEVNSLGQAEDTSADQPDKLSACIITTQRGMLGQKLERLHCKVGCC